MSWYSCKFFMNAHKCVHRLFSSGSVLFLLAIKPGLNVYDTIVEPMLSSTNK